MEVRAVLKNVRVQPRKVRIVADEVKGKSATHVANVLGYHPSKGAHYLRKTLISAIANAQENYGISADSLVIARISVDQGPVFKRIQARAMGRAFRIQKKTSHITVVVEDSLEPKDTSKSGGTKAKPRPTFASAKKKPVKAKTSEKTVEAAAAEPVAEAAPVEETVETTPETAPETQEEQN
jgi:large subunit ribosomal protein L22